MGIIIERIQPAAPGAEYTRLLHKSKDPLLPRSNQERTPRKTVIPAKLVPAKAGSGNPEAFVVDMDSRFPPLSPRFLPAFAGMTGDDDLKTAVVACRLSSLAVNLSHALFRPENPVFCAVNMRMGRHFT